MRKHSNKIFAISAGGKVIDVTALLDWPVRRRSQIPPQGLRRRPVTPRSRLSVQDVNGRQHDDQRGRADAEQHQKARIEFGTRHCGGPDIGSAIRPRRGAPQIPRTREFRRLDTMSAGKRNDVVGQRIRHRAMILDVHSGHPQCQPTQMAFGSKRTHLTRSGSVVKLCGCPMPIGIGANFTERRSPIERGAHRRCRGSPSARERDGRSAGSG